MSSEEIVKLLRRCMFSDTLLQIAADKIEELESETNRLKAEIERLQKANERFKKEFDSYCTRVKSEARKEFVNMAKQRICKNVSAPTPGQRYVMKKFTELLDNLVKEMENKP